jgi:hypothetical protein
MKHSSIRALYIVAGLALVGALASGETRRKQNDKQEMLLPFTNAFDGELRPILDEKLLVTSANFGRMIRMPAGPTVGESAVSVYCNSGEWPNAHCYVTLTRVKSNLDYIASEHRRTGDGLQQARQVGVVRKDAEVNATTATAFRDCLKAMIPPEGDHRLQGTVGLHDERIEFWLAEPDSPPRSGEVYEQRGKRANALVQMGTLLAQYCEASRPQRAGIAKQINEQATRILSK